MPRKKNPLVALQGEPGAFSHSAALKLLGENIRIYPCSTFKHVFEALAAGTVTHAVIPIENTLYGSVLENYDHLVHFNFPICGETSIRICHHLIAMPGVRFGDVQRAFSHPVALSQCRRFFELNRQIEAVSFYDTAGSVKMLKERKPPFAAAVASEVAAEIYGARILRRHLEDDRRNFTRFFLLTKQAKMPRDTTGAWKTSVAFSTANKPGALFRAMACLALRDINLTKIESRPLFGKPWEYLFYVDFSGSRHNKAVSSALANLAEVTQFCKLLGSYRPTP